MASSLTEPKTGKGRQTLEHILQAAFRLFLLRGYEASTIVELIETSGMSRGAIFYYAPDKLSLYRAVVDRFVIEMQALVDRVTYDDDTSLYEFMLRYIRRVSEVMDDLRSIPGYTPALYFNMVYQASIYYPESRAKITELFVHEDKTWGRIIERDIRRGLLRGDIDVRRTVQHFRHAYLGLSVEVSLSRTLDVDELKELFLDIYDKIKT